MYSRELLAPAREVEAITPLIEAGADALYIGLYGFSSRPASADFTLEEIKMALDICHEKDTSVHIAINGCVTESKLNELKENIAYLDEMGVDAVILADWGIIFQAGNIVKNAEIHASTLLGVYNSQTVRYLKKIGVKRLVFSTNMYIDEIADIINSVPDMEYEIVADGGICFNDNRICELPHINEGNEYKVFCRQKYKLLLNGKEYEANPIAADMISSKEIVCMYLQLGINSFKIEGRTSDYQYIVPRVRALRKKIDECDLLQPSTLHYINRIKNRIRGNQIL